MAHVAGSLDPRLDGDESSGLDDNVQESSPPAQSPSSTIPSSVMSLDADALSTTSISSSATGDPSVIVGLAFRFPNANTKSQLWENLATKKDLRRRMPAQRFNVDGFYHPKGTNKGTVSLTALKNNCTKESRTLPH